MNPFLHNSMVLWIGPEPPAPVRHEDFAAGPCQEIKFEHAADLPMALSRVQNGLWDATVVQVDRLPGNPLHWLKCLSRIPGSGDLIVCVAPDTPLPRIAEWINNVQGLRLLLDPPEPAALLAALAQGAAWRQESRGERSEGAAEQSWLNLELARLTKKATIDNLTGLLRREEFTHRGQEEFDRAQRTQQPLIGIMCDIDHFKRVNDTLGHQAGDRALQVVARLLGHDRRAYDLVGRMGGEEFMLLMPGPTLEEGIQIAERLRERLQAFDWAGEKLPGLTMSFGVAELHHGRYESLTALCAAADAALYTAKNGGRNRVCRAEAPTPHAEEAASRH